MLNLHQKYKLQFSCVYYCVVVCVLLVDFCTGTWSAFVLLRSVLESADQALRQKPRQPTQPSIMSSVVRSPPPKSSVQKISSEPASSGDIRTVVHTRPKHHKHRHHSTSSHQRSVTDRSLARTSEQLLITVTEEEASTMANNDQQPYRSAFEERKVSVLDEDQFEPDYDENETAVDVEHKPCKESSGEHRKHSRQKHSHRLSSHADSASKSKKHKKQKKSKKHKGRSKKAEK